MQKVDGGVLTIDLAVGEPSAHHMLGVHRVDAELLFGASIDLDPKTMHFVEVDGPWVQRVYGCWAAHTVRQPELEAQDFKRLLRALTDDPRLRDAALAFMGIGGRWHELVWFVTVAP